MNDWWDRLYSEPVSGSDANPGSQATEEVRHSPNPNRALAKVTRISSGAIASPPHIPSSVSRWGSGRELDPFLRKNPAHPDLVEEEPSKESINTPEESDELRRHKEKLVDDEYENKDNSVKEKDSEDVPPVDNEEPGEPEEGKSKKREGWKERARAIKGQVREKLNKASTATEPARKGTAKAFNSIAPDKGKKFSFLWSFIAAWVISPQFFLALVDRIFVIFGAPRYLSGEEPAEWVWINGVGPWFGDQVEVHLANGTTHRLILLFLVGIGPVLVAQFSEKIPDSRVRRVMGWIGYGFPVFFTCSISYIPAMGFHSWSELYVSLFAALSWWGFSFSRTIKPGFSQCALRIPLAAIVVGIGLNAPGAAF